MGSGTAVARPLARLALRGGVLALVGLPVLAPAQASPPAEVASVPGPVVLVGTSGIRWTDVGPATPALWSLVADGASGSLAVRSIRPMACPADGWLAVSSGRLAADEGSAVAGSCADLITPVDGAAVPDWDRYVASADDDDRSAQLGLLGASLRTAGHSAAAVGPGAAIAIATPDGAPVGPVAAIPADPTDLAALVESLADRTDVLVVDLGGLQQAGAASTQFILTGSAEPTPFSREAAVQALDAQLSVVLEALPDQATVLVASVADDGTRPHLQVLGARGPALDGAYAEATLGSSSTRQPRLAQTTDLPPTVLSLLGIPSPDSFVGAPVTPTPSAASPVGRLQLLRDTDQAAQRISPYAVWFFTGLIAVQLVMYAVGFLLLRRSPSSRSSPIPASPGPSSPSRPSPSQSAASQSAASQSAAGGRVGATGRRGRVLTALRCLGIGFACVPVATFPANLVPWWRSDSGFLVLSVTVAALAAGLAILALTGPWRRRLLGPLGFVGGITALVLAVDVVAGSRLMISSLMGLQPLVAGRFYGLGNVAFALFATGSLLFATALADALVKAQRRSVAVVVTVLVGATAVLIDGAPGLGSDFGGPLALIPAFAVLVVVVGRMRSSWRLGVGIAVATIVVVLSLALLDWSRDPGDRTHLGRFVDSVANGETWQVIGRKLEQNLSILVGTPTGPLVPLVVIALSVAVVRPQLLRLPVLEATYERAPALRPGLLAVLIMLGLGFAFNDSGTAVPAVSAAMTVPLLVATASTVARESLRNRAGQVEDRSAAARPTDASAPSGGASGDATDGPVEPLR